MSEAYVWDGDWGPVESEIEREALEKELQRELCPAHVLYGKAATALARRWRRSDILFGLEEGGFAQVHLTYKIETQPEWPWTEVYSSFAAWKAVPVEDR